MSTARKSRAPGPGAAMRRISIRVAGLRGVQRLANDATVAVTDLVEAMHDAVLLTPGVLARRIDGRTPGIAMNCRDATLTAAFRCSNAGSAPVVWSWSPSIRASNVRADSTASRPEASRHRGDHAAPGLRVHGHEPRPQDDRVAVCPSARGVKLSIGEELPGIGGQEPQPTESTADDTRGCRAGCVPTNGSR